MSISLSSTAAAALPTQAAQARERDSNPAWYLWCAALSVTSANVGGQWDIAWHRSIGRDGFWTAPHVAIYLCGVLAGIACGYLILSTTLGPAAAQRSSIRVWGLRGPLGAFIASWGGVAMLASAPFDNWWHGAYGLDVKILSPPHVVLMLGILAIQIGSLVLILGEMNRAEGSLRRRLRWLFLYVGGMILCSQGTAIMEYSARVSLHSAMFYRAAALAFVAVMVGVARAADDRFAAARIALIYTAFFLLLLWILPLVPAQPKLGPVERQITHLIPAGFPLLLLAPALAIDLLWARLAALPPWRLALLTGTAFLLCLLAVEWPFAIFLNSPAAHNALFGSGYLDYRTGPASAMAQNRFRLWEHSSGEFWEGLGIALLSAVAMARLGLAWGDWMRKIRR